MGEVAESQHRLVEMVGETVLPLVAAVHGRGVRRVGVGVAVAVQDGIWWRESVAGGPRPAVWMEGVERVEWSPCSAHPLRWQLTAGVRPSQK